MSQITLTAIDLSKDVFEIRSENRAGRLIKRTTVSRKRLMRILVMLPKGSTVAMEACSGSHYLARKVRERGLEPKLIAPQFVTPFRKSQKNDRNDAEAICIAARQPKMRFVAIKSEAQLDLQMLHRVREGLVKTQTMLINQVRALLLEHGIVLPQTITQFRKNVPLVLCKGQGGELFQFVLHDLWEQLCALQKKLDLYTSKIKHEAHNDERCESIMKLNGIGEITATAMVSRMGEPSSYKNGRAYAASLGLVPRQFSSAGRTTLGHITKCGDGYVRKLLVHGARTVIRHAVARKKTDPLSLWIRKLQAKKGTNLTSVALANKNARHVWALLAGKRPVAEPLPQAA